MMGRSWELAWLQRGADDGPLVGWWLGLVDLRLVLLVHLRVVRVLAGCWPRGRASVSVELQQHAVLALLDLHQLR